MGGTEQICLPGCHGVHLSGSPSSSSLSYLPEGRQQVHSVEKHQELHELIKPAESAVREGLKDIYLAPCCWAIPQVALAKQFLLLSAPGFHLETSHGGHAHQEPCVTPDTQPLLPKTWTYTPQLVLSSSKSDSQLADGQQDQPATLLLKLPIIEVSNFPTGH